MRTHLILAAAALAAPALPAQAQAQRLDTRVREVTTTKDGVECRLNANRDMTIEARGDRRPALAFLLQRPVDPPAGPLVSLGFIFDPKEGGRFGVGARAFSVNFLDMRIAPAPPPVRVRLLIDGADSGVELQIFADADRPHQVFVAFPEEVGVGVAQGMLRARWIDVDVTNRDNGVVRYRFDGRHISDSAEILSIVKFGCDGARAD